ncbi:MAG: DUF2513 domain-containing protein [Lachnospiraceae bacterium]|nr:DUF2513 domain-containing protein [Lachnospiraceae bacterium]
MQLDYSCIRNILLTVEKYETLYDPVSFSEFECDYYDDCLSEYSIEQILYHVQYCIKASLLSDICPTKVWGKLNFDCRLEPLGHDFLANVRTVEKWKRTQNILSKIGGASLKVLSAVAEGVTTSLANKYLPSEIEKIIS